ncbi:MAG: ABC transporter permease [Pseudomonadota bacterium]
MSQSMPSSVLVIEPLQLLVSAVPALCVAAVLFVWSLNARNALYAMARMLGQLLVIGYLLGFLFDANNVFIILGVLSVMVCASSWIALGSIPIQRRDLLPATLLSVTIGGSVTLLIISQGVLMLDPWYMPRYLIPLAGMVFAASMNSISLAADRIVSELKQHSDYVIARNTALHTALIPVTNSLLAVGLVSLPGMMTGQILSGVSPLIAVRYQIMVMCMLYGAAGMSCICFLVFNKKLFLSQKQIP